MPPEEGAYVPAEWAAIAGGKFNIACCKYCDARDGGIGFGIGTESADSPVLKFPWGGALPSVTAGAAPTAGISRPVIRSPGVLRRLAGIKRGDMYTVPKSASKR
jgi:hypothetical protein